jgi:hypothetical protein
MSGDATQVFGSFEQNEKGQIINSLDKKNYESIIVLETADLNMAFYKIFSDYFNIIDGDENLRKKYNIKEIRFFRNKTYLNSIELVSYWDETDVMFKYYSNIDKKWIEFCFAFDKYKQNSEVIYSLIIRSKEMSYLENDVIYKEILRNALRESNLKGSYIEMKRNQFSWKRKELEKRNFDDIFLPASTLSDLKLYIDVFDKKNIMMRYLLVGHPGTGKTESSLVLANALKSRGVTIVKTPVCKLLKEKIELAEALAPSILLFDDLDLSIGSRSKGGYSPEELQGFLDAMDGTDKINKDVGIISTTNSAHLLDLAAQRPGRFEKILSFNSLTKRNIGNIILKSLKYNFDIIKSNGNKTVIDLFYNRDVINSFYNSSVTGAHIFNSIKMLKLKLDMSEKNHKIEWIIKELNEEINMINSIRRIDTLQSKTSNTKQRGVGFIQAIISDEDEGEWIDGDWYDTETTVEEPNGEKCQEEKEVRRNNPRK